MQAAAYGANAQGYGGYNQGMQPANMYYGNMHAIPSGYSYQYPSYGGPGSQGLGGYPAATGYGGGLANQYKYQQPYVNQGTAITSDPCLRCPSGPWCDR